MIPEDSVEGFGGAVRGLPRVALACPVSDGTPACCRATAGRTDRVGGGSEETELPASSGCAGIRERTLAVRSNDVASRLERIKYPAHPSALGFGIPR